MEFFENLENYISLKKCIDYQTFVECLRKINSIFTYRDTTEYIEEGFQKEWKQQTTYQDRLEQIFQFIENNNVWIKKHDKQTAYLIQTLALKILNYFCFQTNITSPFSFWPSL